MNVRGRLAGVACAAAIAVAVALPASARGLDQRWAWVAGAISAAVGWACWPFTRPEGGHESIAVTCVRAAMFGALVVCFSASLGVSVGSWHLYAAGADRVAQRHGAAIAHYEQALRILESPGMRLPGSRNWLTVRGIVTADRTLVFDAIGIERWEDGNPSGARQAWIAAIAAAREDGLGEVETVHIERALRLMPQEGD